MTTPNTPKIANTDNHALNPHLVNLHHLLGTHLSGIAPLVADMVNVSIGQARVLCTHAIDATLIFYLKKNESPPQSLDYTHYHKNHQWLHNSPVDTHTLKRLHTKNCEQLFFGKTDEIVKRIALLAKVSPSVAKQAVTLISELCQHHIEMLCVDSKLDNKQKRQWFELQTIFLKEYNPSQFWSALAEHSFTAPNISESDYRAKKGGAFFDQNIIKMPNYAWLLTLANHIGHKHQKPLTIGQILHPFDAVFDEQSKLALASLTNNIESVKNGTAKPQKTPAYRNDDSDKSSNLFAWLVSGAVMATAVGVFAVPKLFNDDNQKNQLVATQKQTPSTKTQALGHQDIAIVRVKDDELQAKTSIATKPKDVDKKTENKTTAKTDNKPKSDNRTDKTLAKKSETNKTKADKAKERERQNTLAKAERADKTKTDNKTNKVAQKPKTDNKADARLKADNKKVVSDKATPKKIDNTVVNSPKTTKTTAKADNKTDKRTETVAKTPTKAAPKPTNQTANASKPTTPKPVAKPTTPKPNNTVATPKSSNTPKPELLTTIRVEPIPTFGERNETSERPKNKNKNNSEPIINQDTIGKLGN